MPVHERGKPQWQPQWGPADLRAALGVTDAGQKLKSGIKRALEGPTPDDRFAAAVQAQKDQELIEAYRWAQQQERARQTAQAQSGPVPTSAAALISRELAGPGAGQAWSNTGGLANQVSNAIAARPQ